MLLFPVILRHKFLFCFPLPFRRILWKDLLRERTKVFLLYRHSITKLGKVADKWNKQTKIPNVKFYKDGV
mgnify:CR=1 FL=1